MPGAADTLFLPIINGDVSLASGRWLYLGAQAPARGFPDGLIDHLVCEQPLRDPFLDLQMRGIDVQHSCAEDIPFVGAFILIGKHRGENEAMLARASELCRDGSKILIAGDKTSGIGSFKKRLAHDTPIDGSFAKYHATVFWMENGPGLIETGNRPQSQMPDGFKTAPGMFSPEKVDKGSALLATYIDKSIRGDVADFGAGWGYLAKTILAKGAVNSLDLFEAHWPSLEAAMSNVNPLDKVATNFHWHDITREPISRRYDCVVMNPPFHAGRKSEPALGEKFIEVAATVLKPKGRLLMVANSGLPYEKKLLAHFKHSEELTKQHGFKVLLAQK